MRTRARARAAYGAAAWRPLARLAPPRAFHRPLPVTLALTLPLYRNDADTIEATKIEAGATVHMVLSLRGGAF